MAKAKKEINILPVGAFEKSLPGKIFSWALNLGRYIVIGIELIVIIAFLSRLKLDMDLVNLNESIKEKQAIIESFGDLEEKVRFLQERIKITKKLAPTQLGAVDILESLSQITPSDTYLTDFSLDQKGFAMEAVALSEGSLSVFLAGLQRSEKFEEINLTSLTSSGLPSLEIKFTLKANLK